MLASVGLSSAVANLLVSLTILRDSSSSTASVNTTEDTVENAPETGSVGKVSEYVPSFLRKQKANRNTPSACK